MKLIIKSIDGTAQNTEIFDADTGETVEGIIKIECFPGEYWKAHIEVIVEELDILAHEES